MSYKVGRVHYVNFGPFEDEEHDFSVPGLTCVDAEFSGRLAMDSNGCGKSMMYDGVVWCLFDRCLRAHFGKDDVIRGDWDEEQKINVVPKGRSTSVTVHITGPRNIKVTRYRKHKKFKNEVRLEIDGVDDTRGRNDATTRAVERAIGLDFIGFVNSVAFGAREDVKAFLSESTPDSERKKVLDSILGLEVYTEGETWTIRNVLAHLVTAERGLFKLFKRVRGGGMGVNTK